MAKYIIDSATLDGLGDAIRSVTGSTKKYTPEEMIAEVKDILNATTFILVDKDGNEYPAVYVDSDTVITATPNDIRKGTTAITAEGVITGEKVIPAYYTTEGIRIVPVGSDLKIPFSSDRYDFTKLQAIICPFTSSYASSVAAEKVVIDENVYNVKSVDVVSIVQKDSINREVHLGVTNDSDTPYVLRYFTYKEEY